MIFKKIDSKAIITFLILIITSVSILLTNQKIANTTAFDFAELKGSFTVTESPVYHGTYYSTVLETKSLEKLKSNTKIRAYSNKANFEIGDIITADISLKKVNSKYKKSSYSDGIYLTGSLNNVTVSEKGGDLILHTVGKLRKYIVNTLFEHMEYKEAATLTAIVFGDRSYMSDSFYDKTKSAGITHALVVSGMHLAVIVGLITGLLEKFIYNRYIKALAILLTVIFMSALCGFTKSILRAGICYLLYALSVLLRRDNNSENTLGGAVCIILIISPFTVFSISFLLSVLSTLGIICAAVPTVKYIKDKEIFKYKILLSTSSSILVTIAALIFTLPITSYIFGYTSNVSIPANLLISLPTTAALCISAVGLIIYPLLPFLGGPILIIAGYITKFINSVIDFFGSLPFAVFYLNKFSFVFAVLLLFAVILFLFKIRANIEKQRLKEMHEKIISETKKSKYFNIKK